MTRHSGAKKMQRPAMMRIVVAALAMAMAVTEVLCDGQCGDGTGKVCAEGFCCSNWGYCGTTAAYCAPGNCQSQCWDTNPPPPPPPPPRPPPSPTPSGGGVADIITEEVFEEMLLHRNDPVCPASGFYTYSAFIEAANSFPEFGTEGDLETRKRELAAFLAQTSHETTGGWDGAPDGRYAWGYCFNREINGELGPAYCDPTLYPCVDGQKYYGRGPIQLSWNYNYAQAGDALGLDLLSNPDLVATDAFVSFETAIWFWMTPQYPKPSCHDVMIGEWTPTANDIAANRLPGYGVTTNIINGGLECGFGPDDRQKDRIGFYERYCQILGVSPGDYLDCNDQRPFNWLTVNSRGKTAVRTSPVL